MNSPFLADFQYAAASVEPDDRIECCATEPIDATVTREDGSPVKGRFRASSLIDDSMSPTYAAGELIVFDDRAYSTSRQPKVGHIVFGVVQVYNRRNDGKPFGVADFFVIRRFGKDAQGNPRLCADKPGAEEWTHCTVDGIETDFIIWGRATNHTVTLKNGESVFAVKMNVPN